MAVAPAQRRLKHWGWGYEDQQPPFSEVRTTAAGIRQALGFAPSDAEEAVPLEAVSLPAPRLSPPASLAGICSSSPYDRASRAYGKAYRDVVRGFRGEFGSVPDVVALPVSEEQVVAVLDWCSSAGAACVPFGGGTSVVGGVEARVGDSYSGIVTLDLRGLGRVLEVDRASRAALIEAGATGPALEEALKPHGYTLRHFPQSFEYSTLGGWIATRAGGHFATLMTHIDDLVESVRAVTPARGVWESRRLPGSGAGPSPDRMLIGSEGILGVITRAWVRVQDRPKWRATASVRFEDLASGADAARALSQSGLYPSNCRLLDPGEAALTGAAGPEGGAVLVLGFESADHALEPWLARALELCLDFGGAMRDEPVLKGPESSPEGARGGSAGAWRDAFVQMPYMRDTLVAAGVIAETFETAITWDRFDEFVSSVRAAVSAAVTSECGAGVVNVRLTHVYPDGAAPYFTVLAPGRRGSEVSQWDTIKAVAQEAIIAAGGTITHHHAVGRDHRPGYDKQRPDPFASALRAAKRSLDPNAVLNPGVLIDP
jgi:alkyldihydroxyacetonephosphate synthase